MLWLPAAISTEGVTLRDILRRKKQRPTKYLLESKRWKERDLWGTIVAGGGAHRWKTLETLNSLQSQRKRGQGTKEFTSLSLLCPYRKKRKIKLCILFEFLLSFTLTLCASGIFGRPSDYKNKVIHKWMSKKWNFSSQRDCEA